MVDGLRVGVLLLVGLCRLGVRTKLGINMVGPVEAGHTRLSKEGRTGPGRTRSRQKSPCQAVVGSRPRAASVQQLAQYSWTHIFFFFSFTYLFLLPYIVFKTYIITI